MSMFERIEQFISEHPEHKEIIVKTILRYNEIWDEWLDKRCSICDRLLDAEDESMHTPHDFSKVCKKHREYANVFQVDMIRKQLGMPAREFINQSSLESLL